VLAVDALTANGGEAAILSEQTLAGLNKLLPPHWSHGNPIDVLGDADSARYAKAVEIATQDPNSDGLLAILTPQGMTDPQEFAKQLQPYANSSGKPLLASWMGGASIAAADSILNSAGIPTFRYPDTAARAFTYMWRYSENLRLLYETPSLTTTEISDSGRDNVRRDVENARASGRTLLTEPESKKILAAYGIPVVETRIAVSEEDAVRVAREIGFPVVLKLFSEKITHKTDVGGVKLDLASESAVRKAYREIRASVTEKAGEESFVGVTVQPMIAPDGYELILGSSIDPQFGPVLLFGSGGQLVEVYKDRALALPPLNTTLAERLMERTQIYKALQGVRGRKAVDLPALKNLLVRFSQLIVEQPSIKEIDINPLFASPDRLLALDARIVLHGPDMKPEDLPKPAIRPYPSQYISSWKMNDGREFTFRPIRPEDEPMMVEFHSALSDRTVYLRYFASMSLSSRIAHERLLRICFGGYEREIVLIVEQRSASPGNPPIVAVGRINKLPDGKEAEIAVLIADKLQGCGLGNELLKRLVKVAREEQMATLRSEMLYDDVAMQIIATRVGFQLHKDHEAGSVLAVLNL
jgi:acetyltransferase